MSVNSDQDKYFAECDVCKGSVDALELDLTAYGWTCDDCRRLVNKTIWPMNSEKSCSKCRTFIEPLKQPCIYCT